MKIDRQSWEDYFAEFLRILSEKEGKRKTANDLGPIEMQMLRIMYERDQSIWDEFEERFPPGLPRRMEYGFTEPYVIPFMELQRDDRAQIQSKMIFALVRQANELGLDGKRVCEIIVEPKLIIEDLSVKLKWER